MTEDEFRSAFHEHQDVVYRFLWRMAGAEAAEDLAQDVFLALLRYPNRFDPARGSLRTFLLAIARNLVLKQWRDSQAWTELDEERFVAPAFDVTAGERADRVAAAVRSLPPLQREAIILAEYERCSLEEIARTVAAEVGTVKSRLHRARENLRRMLAPLRSSVRSGEYKVGKGSNRGS